MSRSSRSFINIATRQAFISLLCILACIYSVYAQSVSPSVIDSLRTKDIPVYIDNDGNIFTERPMEFRGIEVVFYSCRLNRTKHEMTLAGRIWHDGQHGDTTGVPNYVFLGTPDSGRLTHIRPLVASYSHRLYDRHPDRFPYRTGDFKVHFVFNRRERLYFNGEMSFPAEYQIGNLLKNQ